MSASRLFVTGSGTGVGKTHVSCGLLARWRAQGRAVDALKPVLSGFDPDQAADSDAGRLLSALGRAVDDSSLAAMSPLRFGPPLSPDQAAAKEQRRLTAHMVREACSDFLQRVRAEVALIEGVGGVMVPLDERHTVLDVIDALSLPVLLVVDNALGTLSHTLTAHRALSARGLRVLTVMNAWLADGPEVEDQVRSLCNHLAGPVVTLQDFAQLGEEVDRFVPSHGGGA